MALKIKALISIIFPIYFLIFFSGCQNKKEQRVQPEEVDTVSVEEVSGINFETFIGFFENGNRSEPIPEPYSQYYLNGTSYTPYGVISNNSNVYAVVISNLYASEYYAVHTFSPEGKKIDHKVILESEGGHLYHYKFEIIDETNFVLSGRLDLSLYDGFDGPMSEEEIKSYKKELVDPYIIDENGMILKKTSNSMPVISGNYNDNLLFLAHNGDYLTGYYSNGRYQGNPNFGCSFYFYGSSSTQTDERKTVIKTLNPFDLLEEAKQGTFKLHGEEDNIFSLIADLNGEECWDNELGFAEIGESPGISFELNEVKEWSEIRIASSEKVYFHDSNNDSSITKTYVIENDPLLISKNEGEWLMATYIGSNSTTSGWIKKSYTKSLIELAER